MIAPTLTVSLPISARRSEWAPHPTRTSTAFRMPAKLQFAGLLGSQAKCASRLAGAIRGLFNVKAEVEEFIGTRLVLEANELTQIGQHSSRLGENVLLGRNVFSVQDKIRMLIFTNAWRSMSDSFRPATCANLWPIWYSSTMANSSTGTSSWRFRLALPSRFGSESSASLAGRPGWRRIGRQRKPTDAMPGFILPSA